MAKLGLLLFTFFCVFSCCAPQFGLAYLLEACKFHRIYQLGDSISDTGNLIREFPVGATNACGRLPYGETFFNNATGRCSNGLLMIDYIAMAAGLPLLPPYKTMVTADFSHGVNFAVVGSTALSSEVLASRNISLRTTNSSLEVQLDWMTHHFNSICLDHRDCVEKIQNALFIFGFAGNDYNNARRQGKTTEELRSMVPDVVASITDAARKVIDMGAKKLVIAGVFPGGCLPAGLASFQSNVSADYDEYQCAKQLNEFPMYHNEVLQQAIHKLQQEKPNTIIVYGDYYNAYLFLLKFGKDHGFETQKACCGIGGKYNFDFTRMCGGADVPVCEDPDQYVSWDGVHLTQQGYKIMTGWLLDNVFDKLHCPS